MSYDPDVPAWQHDDVVAQRDERTKERDEMADVNAKLRQQIKALQHQLAQAKQPDSIFEGLPAAQFEADIATEKAKEAIAEAEAVLSKTDKQRVAIIRNILDDLEAANGPMDDATKGPIVDGFLDMPTEALVNLRDLSYRRRRRQTADPTDAQVEKVYDMLVAKPKLALAVGKLLVKNHIAGPWELDARGAHRSSVNAWVAIIEAADSQDTPPFTATVLRDRQRVAVGDFRSYAAAMDACDKELEKDGMPIAEPRPFKIVTAWREHSGKHIRLHDVPGKNGQWPKVAIISPQEVDDVVRGTRSTVFQWELTMQAMIDVPDGDAPITGHAGTLEDAQDVVDTWLLNHGWMTP